LSSGHVGAFVDLHAESEVAPRERTLRCLDQYWRDPSAARSRISWGLSPCGVGRSLTRRETELLDTPSRAVIWL
jgi:hypothetical protein